MLGFCDIIIKESKTAIPGFVPFFSRCSCRCSNSALCKQRMHNAQVHCPTIGLLAGTDRNIQKKTVWFTDIFHAVFFCAYMGNAHSPIHINAQPPIRSQNAHTRTMHTHIYVIMHGTLYAMHTHIYAAVRRLIQNFARPHIRYNAQPPIRKNARAYIRICTGYYTPLGQFCVYIRFSGPGQFFYVYNFVKK